MWVAFDRARIERFVSESAEKRIGQQVLPEGSSDMDENEVPRRAPAAGVETIRANIESLQKFKNWMLASMSVCFGDPPAASQELRAMAAEVADANPSMKQILEDLELGKDSASVLDFSTFGARLQKVEAEQLDIQKDLDQAGPVRRRRGRPFGAKGKKKKQRKDPQEECGEPGGPSEKKQRKKQRGKKKKASKGEEQEQAVDVEGEADEDPIVTDGELEEEEDEPNKTVTIPLYAKCLVVEFAKQVIAEGTVHSVEREVMTKFKKYFFSYKSGQWKSGLLGKWMKPLSLDFSLYNVFFAYFCYFFYIKYCVTPFHFTKPDTYIYIYIYIQYILYTRLKREMCARAHTHTQNHSNRRNK